MSEKIRWGILGTGAIATCLAENLPKGRTGTIVAVGSRSQESAQAFAEKNKIPTAHGSYNALLADPNVEAIYVSLPHPFHAEWTIKAVRAGKHVLCEKPFALNAAQATAMIDAAEQSGVTLMEAFMWRCHPQTAELIRLIREKEIGDVKMITASFGFKSDFNASSRLWSNELAGGGLMDVGCYPVSAARLIAGAAAGKPFLHPNQITGSGVLAETGVDAIAAATLRFENGVIAQVSTALVTSPENDVKVFGTDGWLHLPEPWLYARRDATTGKILVHKNGTTRQIDVPADYNTFTLEADVMGDTLRAGRQQAASPAMTWDDTLSQARTLDAWRLAVGVVYHEEKPENYPAVTVSGGPLKLGGTIPHGRIKGLDKPVSRLVLGCDNQTTFPTMAVIADAFFEAGGNTFDTAWGYGGGVMERLLGQWIKHRGVREQTTLVVKGVHTPLCFPDVIGKQLQESLERLETDYADVYVMHRDNLDVPVGEFVDALNDHVAAGRIKVFGGSNWTIDRVKAANDYAHKNGRQGFAVLSNNFSMARMVEAPWRGCVASSDDESRRWLEQTQTALLPWSSQAQGFFVDGRVSDDKPAEPMLERCWYGNGNLDRLKRARELAAKRGVPTVQIALAYVLHQKFPVFALIGPRTVSELRSSLPGLRVELTDAEIKWLDLRD